MMDGNAGRLVRVLMVNDDTPSRRLTIGNLAVGNAVEQRYVFDEDARAAFARLANDRAPVHEDMRFAHVRGFQGPIIQGLCVAARFSRLIGMYLPGEDAILEKIELKYRHPTYQNRAIIFRAEVIRILRPMRVVRLALSAMSQDIVLVTGEAQCLVR